MAGRLEAVLENVQLPALAGRVNLDPSPLVVTVPLPVTEPIENVLSPIVQRLVMSRAVTATAPPDVAPLPSVRVP